jgi:hypothetical protein
MTGRFGWGVLAAWLAVAVPSAQQSALDTAGIAKAIGRQGTAQGDVYRVRSAAG